MSDKIKPRIRAQGYVVHSSVFRLPGQSQFGNPEIAVRHGGTSAATDSARLRSFQEITPRSAAGTVTRAGFERMVAEQCS